MAPRHRITPDGTTAYVVNQGSSTVTPSATATNRAGKPIRSGNGPLAIAMAPVGRPSTPPIRATAATADTVTPISTATNRPG